MLFPDPDASIISLPEIPPYPEPLHEWYESTQVTETFASFDAFLAQAWADLVEKAEGQ